MKSLKNRITRCLYALAVISILSAFSSITPFQVRADTIEQSDFSRESWSKVVDFFDYARTYAEQNGLQKPVTDAHAYVYTVYINKAGLRVFYTGLVNITSNNHVVTIPVQTFFEHYKTPGGKDALSMSSFISLLAFNETTATLYPGSPDMSDNLWASFSFGTDMSGFFGTSQQPDLASKATIIPLTSSSDGLQWNWGLRYTNLAAIWWRVYPDPLNATYHPIPVAITLYDELTFTYDLTINPSARTATLQGNYVIGRMRDLFVFRLTLPIVLHYNSTGAYRLDGTLHAPTTIYDFARTTNVKMSLVLFQRSVLLNHETSSAEVTAKAGVTDSEVDVSASAVATTATDGERVFDTSFGAKQAYRLYNYTSDPSESSYSTHDAVTRTVKRGGFARNPVFLTHTFFMRFLPLWISHVHPDIYAKYKEGIVDMSVANYFYVISYPTYGGFRVEHDPTYTSYFAEITGFGTGLFIVVGTLLAAVTGLSIYLLRRRRTRLTAASYAPATPAPTPL